jgi:hypothetical protein
MTPAALETYRLLRNLGVPGETWRKVTITSAGRPDFSRLTDGEFSALMRAFHRAHPGTAGDTPH